MAAINKRQSKLLEIIRGKSSAYVNDLIPLFDVSAATIRKDLTVLEEMSLVQRTHGEVHVISSSDITPIEHRSIQNIRSKRAIAQTAISLISDGNSIILDSGTTTIEIARLLGNFNGLTVITNSLPIAMVLANSKVNVLMPGGILLGENLSTQGPETERYFNSLEVDIAFLAASGVRPQIGFASQNSLEYSVKQSMIKAARYTCAVADTSKFEKSGVHLYARFEEFDVIITETRVQKTALEKLAKDGKVNWLIADESANP
jgi:DeoR/GlpR family transcriptional regulator of sugar metabolism